MDSSSWKAKAEEFLRSHLGDDNTNAEEAAVYFLSREKKDGQISDTINNSLERWRNDKTRWSEKSLSFGIVRAASVLRLMQWGEIGSLKKYQDSICDNLDVPNSNDYYGLLDSNTSAFYPFVFPLFTSDLAINRMNSKLTFLMHLWQNHLSDLFMKKEIFRHSIEEGRQYNQIHATLISAYIFAARRLNYAGIDQEIFEKSVQYLLDNQNDSGLWGYDQTNSDSEEVDVPSFAKYVNSQKHVVLTAMGIHALSSAQPFVSNRCIKNAANWLLQHQHSDGGWHQHDNPKYQHQVHTTVLVLDAIELAEGRKNITYAFELANGGNTVTFKYHDEGPVLQIEVDTQTIIYKGNRIPFGGSGSPWLLFKVLFEKHGKIATNREINEALGYDRDDKDEIKKVVNRLKNRLRDKRLKEIADKIKNSPAVGYYLEV